MQVQVLSLTPIYAVVSVTVNTTDCDSVNMGSIPILLPKENCLVNSAVECLPYKEKVGGSIPSQGTSSLDARQVKA